MPVSVIFCEGGPSSPDIRVLQMILDGICTVKYSGGKHGMNHRIDAWRSMRNIEDGNQLLFGIQDKDFTREWNSLENKPCKWEEGEEGREKTHYGWKWERKEIENYLIDPVVVQKSLKEKSPCIEEYTNELYRARDTIAIYQAARIALSSSRPKYYKGLESSFGNKRGNHKHLFPEFFDEAHCKKGIQGNVQMYREERLVDEATVLNAFETYKTECEKGGKRYNDFLSAFAGKDLLWAMDEWLKQNKYGGAIYFLSKVIQGIEETIDDFYEWLPEWSALRSIVESYN